MRVALFALLAASGAFAQKIDVEFDQGANFGNYKTFAIRDGQLNSRNPLLNNELTKKKIEADIEKYLAARGLTMVTGKSDLNVRYHLEVRRAEHS